MRILLSNQDLSRHGGTQLFTADLARKLLEWGHEPVVHSPWLGAVATELRGRTIAVTSDLRTITQPPDVIIGNYHLGTMTALLQFPGVPAIFICHGVEAIVPRAPRIRRYVAVDEPCRSHLMYECGVGAAQIEVILNAVDLARFPAREALPPRPRRALLFGNQFEGDGAWRAIETACRAQGIETDVAGLGTGKTDPQPEKSLLQYDLVFARARSALEAMATGAAVILAGPTRMGTMVTAADADRYRTLNFGRRLLTSPVTADAVARELARYDPDDALAVMRSIRATASLDLMAAQLVRLIEEVLDEAAPLDVSADMAADYAAAAAYLRTLETDESRIDRLRRRIGTWPFIGPIAVKLARRIMRALER